MSASEKRLASSYTERGPIGIHVSPVGFLLRMLQRIAIALRGRRQKKSGVILVRQLQAVRRAPGADHQRLDAVLHVIDRAGDVEDDEVDLDRVR